MGSVSGLTDNQITELAGDYPDTANEILAARYGVTTRTIEQHAHDRGLRKSPGFVSDRLSAAAIRGVAASAPMDAHPAHPVYPAATYCPTCGLSIRHWASCPNTRRAALAARTAPPARIRRTAVA